MELPFIRGIIELGEPVGDSHFPFAGEGAEAAGVSDRLESVSGEGKISCSIFPVNASRPARCSVWLFPRCVFFAARLIAIVQLLILVGRRISPVVGSTRRPSCIWIIFGSL